MLTYNYSSCLNSTISRLSSLSDSSGPLESYSYMGLGTVVVRSHPQINVDLTYVGTPGDAGDEYAGLDRFGRVVEQLWVNSSTSTTLDDFQYTYDVLGNRTAIDNGVNASFNQALTYDDLSQLTGFTRGTHTQDFNYDAVGNATSVTTDGTEQDRTANAQNQITSISGATTPTYDANGNMLTDETGRQFVFDAWNHLVKVKNSGGTTLETFTYDGLGRRVTSNDGTTTTDLYYSTQQQVLEEMQGGSATARYVWSPVYVNALVLRDRATGSPGTLDERLWAQQDANFNVTALVDGTGAVVERYVYDPYGAVTIYDATYTLRSSSSYAMTILFQGMRYDATSGLYEADARWYSATLQRWGSLDPERFAAGDVNLFRAYSNSPINFTDASGLDRFTFYLSNNLKRETWGAQLKLVWSPDKQAEGGLTVKSWEVKSTMGGSSTAQIIAALTFPNTEMGATAMYKTKSEYSAVFTFLTDPKKSFKKGKFRFGETPFGVKECGYHEVVAKFTLYTSKNKEFQFKVSGLAGGKVSSIDATADNTLVGQGEIRVTIAQNSDGKFFIRGEGALGGHSFGMGRGSHGAGDWTFPVNDVGKVNGIKGFPFQWLIQSLPED